MAFDVDHQLGAMERSVALLDRDGLPASAVRLARSYETTRADLWDTVTNGERIPHWFAPVSGELRLGGRYQVAGNAGGEITACERHSHYALTWEFGGSVSWVDVRVADEGSGRARLALTHTAHLSDHWDTYGPGAAGVGWEMGFLGLALYLADPDWPKPDDLEFATSADGRAFITGSSEGWRRASVAAGTDSDAAAAAARQPPAFYTGEEPEPM
ncbi:MAG: SRPBCC domain-containing protein [Chloroflexi bacterium]|nr:SRPBCC domain-containing protein [Chloroflexota bacterium]